MGSGYGMEGEQVQGRIRSGPRKQGCKDAAQMHEGKIRRGSHEGQSMQTNVQCESMGNCATCQHFRAARTRQGSSILA